MERGNTKHGPAHDEQLAHESEGMVRGSAQRPHGEEWRETEPVENAVPPPRRALGGNPRPESRDVELRNYERNCWILSLSSVVAIVARCG
jgi:hypothetical protein